MPKKHLTNEPDTFWEDQRRYAELTRNTPHKPVAEKRPSKFKTFAKAVGAVIVTDALIKSIKKED